MSDTQMPPPPPQPPGPPSSPYAPPAASGPPGGEGGERLPWEERSRLGFMNALVDTIKLIATAPSNAFRRLRLDGDLLSPILFGVIVSWVGVAVSQIWNIAFGNALQRMLEQMGNAPAQQPGVGALLVTAVLWPLLYILSLFLGSGINHLCLMLVGALDRSLLRFEGTLKVVAYSSVSGLASVVPFVGGLISMIAALVLIVIGFTEVHRTTQGKAVAAVLIPLVLCCVCGVLLIAFFSAALMAILSGMANQ